MNASENLQGFLLITKFTAFVKNRIFHLAYLYVKVTGQFHDEF